MQRLNGVFELSVYSTEPSIPPIKFRSDLWVDGITLVDGSAPRSIDAGGKRQSESLTNFDGGSGKEPSCRFLADDGCEMVLSRKSDNHLGGAGGGILRRLASP